MTRFAFLCFFFNKYFLYIKAKLTVSKSLHSKSAVCFLIRCILDYAQCHLVDFWKKRPANFDFIWLEWNSYNSSIQIHIVWSRSSIFKLKSCSREGWCLCYGGGCQISLKSCLRKLWISPLSVCSSFFKSYKSTFCYLFDASWSRICQPIPHPTHTGLAEN